MVENVPGWILLTVYVVGWIVTARICHRCWKDDPDVAMTTLFTILSAFMWPVYVLVGVPVLAVYGLYRLATASWHMPRLRSRRIATIDEWRRAAGYTEKRIDELERELGIGERR